MLIDVARGSTPLSSRLVLAIPVAYLGGLLAGALIIVGALGCLPFFMLVPWFVARVPWVDRSMSGAIVLCLLLSVPAPVAMGAVWGFGEVEFRYAAFSWMCAAASIAVPKLVFRSLRFGALSGHLQVYPGALPNSGLQQTPPSRSLGRRS